LNFLVVIAIIGLLSSVVLASLNSARARARDAKKKADFNAISIALNMFYDKYGRMPKNYNPIRGACEDSYYDQSMQELVDAGFLQNVPKSLGGSKYCYYNYGGSIIGGLIVTYLETIKPSTTGISPSCRPFTTNWCSHTRSSTAYCICNPM